MKSRQRNSTGPVEGQRRHWQTATTWTSSVFYFLPPVLAAAYFGIKQKWTAIIFPICILLFLLNPIGRQAWLYSAIWLIPFAATFFKKHLILRSQLFQDFFVNKSIMLSPCILNTTIVAYLVFGHFYKCPKLKKLFESIKTWLMRA